jgi:hypothetical protein
MMQFRFARRAGVMLLSVLGAASCSNGTSPGTGKLTVLLKDAAGDVQEAVVTISEITLQGSGGTLVLSTTPVTTDLLTLSSATASLVQAATIPAGSYSQLRFVITGGYLKVDNGDNTSNIYASTPDYAGLPAGATVDGSLQMPSFGQSGLKVTLPGGALTVADGEEKIVVVDFNVAQSFGHVAGQSGSWVMHPVVAATDAAVSGSAKIILALDPAVTLPGGALLSDFQATLTGSDGVDHVLNFTTSNPDGSVEADFTYLAPGDYTFTLTAPAGVASFDTAVPLPATITVTSGATTTTAITIAAAS